MLKIVEKVPKKVSTAFKQKTGIKELFLIKNLLSKVTFGKEFSPELWCAHLLCLG